MNFAHRFLFTFWLLLFGGTGLLASDEKIRLIEELADTLPEEKTFYRWQSATSTSRLLQNGHYDEALYRYFMGMDVDPIHQRAGAGVYISENPHSSAMYAGKGGDIVEVNLARGSRYLDLTDEAVVSRLAAKGITPDEVYQLNPKIVVKYNKNMEWWVLKTQEGVRFRPFVPEKIPPAFHLMNLSKMQPRWRGYEIYAEKVRTAFRRTGIYDPNVWDDPRIRRLFNNNLVGLKTIPIQTADELKDVIASIQATPRTGIEPFTNNNAHNRQRFQLMDKLLSGKDIHDVFVKMPPHRLKAHLILASQELSPAKFTAILEEFTPTFRANPALLEKVGDLSPSNFRHKSPEIAKLLEDMKKPIVPDVPHVSCDSSLGLHVLLAGLLTQADTGAHVTSTARLAEVGDEGMDYHRVFGDERNLTIQNVQGRWNPQALNDLMVAEKDLALARAVSEADVIRNLEFRIRGLQETLRSQIIPTNIRTRVPVTEAAVSDARLVTSLLTPEASFNVLSERFQQLKPRLQDNSLKLEARRFINPTDWQKRGAKTPLIAYGASTMIDWSNGLKYVRSLPRSQELNSELLKSIHRITTRNLSFHGFEGRRLQALRDKGVISEAEFKRLLRKAYAGNEAIHGVPHDALRGAFRSGHFDEIVHRGSQVDENFYRYFTREEMEGAIRNEFIRQGRSDFTEVAPGRFRGPIFYLTPSEIPAAVDKVLARTSRELSLATTLEEKVAVIHEMKRDLMSIHPFLDGNGRTIRLLEEHLLLRHNLPPGLVANEKEFEMTTREAVEFARRNMVEYVNEMIKTSR